MGEKGEWITAERKSLPRLQEKQYWNLSWKISRLRNLFSVNCKQKQYKIHYHDMERVCLHINGLSTDELTALLDKERAVIGLQIKSK